MRVKQVTADEAVGHVLIHNIVGPDGNTVLRKGLRLEACDLGLLRAAGAERAWVAIVEPEDVGEDDAARRIAEMLAGPGLDLSPARGGRVDLAAGTDGVFEVDAGRLLRLNRLPGVAVATATNHLPAARGRRVASVKIVPYAVPCQVLERARSIRGEASGGSILALRPYRLQSAALLTVGREESRAALGEAFGGPLRDRLAAFGIPLTRGPHAGEDEGEIFRALAQTLAEGAEIVLIAGDTSTMDRDDLTPTAIRAAGARIIGYGVPVEPGSLLLLAYHGETPIVGLPGCVRGGLRNTIDLILPRLAAGERLAFRDLVELGHGGLLE